MICSGAKDLEHAHCGLCTDDDECTGKCKENYCECEKSKEKIEKNIDNNIDNVQGYAI